MFPIRTLFSGQAPNRKLNLIFASASKATETTAPTGPAEGIATGVGPDSGVVTVALGDEAASRTMSCYFFDRIMYTATGNGWQALGASASDYQKLIEARGSWNFMVPPKVPYKLISDVAIVDVTVYDGGAYEGNPLT